MKIFLDDIRDPSHVVSWMHKRIGPLNPIYLEGWLVVRSYDSFKEAVVKHIDEITHISFDHDLAEGHYHQNMQEGILDYESEDFNSNDHKTGYHAAKWLKSYYRIKSRPLPVMFVHSMNPVGTENIINLFK